jgi:hypothetical protein
MVSSNQATPRIETSREERAFAQQLLAALQRGWSKNEWPRFIVGYEDQKADVAVVIELTRNHIRSMLGQAKKEAAPKIITPYGVDGGDR